MLLHFAICISGITLLSNGVFCQLTSKGENDNSSKTTESQPKMVSDMPAANSLNETDSDVGIVEFPEEKAESQTTACESEMLWFHAPTQAYTEEGTWEELEDNQLLLKFPLLVEICKDPYKPCSNIAGYMTNSITTKCKQKYINVEVQLKRNNTSTLKIPTACVCSVTSYYFPNDVSLNKYKYKFS